jgi:DNA-binding NarL/FixJ family response regulator
VVEDDAHFRKSLVDFLESNPPLSPIGSFESAEEAFHHIPRLSPDVVLMDIHLPRASGIDCVRRLKAVCPELVVLILTVYQDEDLIFEAFKAGASGFLIKQKAAENLLESIQEALSGGAPMSSQVARKVIQYFHQQGRAMAELDELSPRELQVLQELSRGYLYKEIAEGLSISFETVREYTRNIYRKLQVRSRTEAVAKYLRQQG